MGLYLQKSLPAITYDSLMLHVKIESRQENDCSGDSKYVLNMILGLEIVRMI